jgi:3-hydroxyisobutyrate dehydrogenase/2-hydroxy-3-oxopropionate reductase
MAARFLDAGHDVIVWNRTIEKAAPLTDRGAAVPDSPADAARRAEVLITMLSDPAALREVTEGQDGVIAGAGDGLTMIEMSTVGPSAISRLAEALPGGVDLMDAPVLGSLTEAEAGELLVFAGGPQPLVERWTPLLSEVGEVIPAGPLGSGAKAKLVANSTLFGVLGVLGEALRLADALGLDRDLVFRVLAGTPVAAQAKRRLAVIESGEAPVRFSLSLARKDADLVAEAAKEAGIDLPIAEAARRWFEAADDAGLGDEDYSRVLNHILGR